MTGRHSQSPKSHVELVADLVRAEAEVYEAQRKVRVARTALAAATSNGRVVMFRPPAST